MNDRERAEREAGFGRDMLHRNMGLSDLRRAVDALSLAHEYALRALNDAEQEQDQSLGEFSEDEPNLGREEMLG